MSKDNTIDLFSGKTISKINEEEEESRKELIDSALTAFDKYVKDCRDKIEQDSMGSMVISAIDSEGYMYKPTFIYAGKGCDYAKCSLTLEDVAETLKVVVLSEMDITFEE